MTVDRDALPTCDGCGEDLTDEVFFADQRVICRDCFSEYIKDNYTPEELADACGIGHMALREYLEDIP